MEIVPFYDCWNSVKLNYVSWKKYQSKTKLLLSVQTLKKNRLRRSVHYHRANGEAHPFVKLVIDWSSFAQFKRFTQWIHHHRIYPHVPLQQLIFVLDDMLVCFFCNEIHWFEHMFILLKLSASCRWWPSDGYFVWIRNGDPMNHGPWSGPDAMGLYRNEDHWEDAAHFTKDSFGSSRK